MSMRIVYRKIDFIHAQCLAFIADRERKLLLGGFSIPRLYLASDRQEYIVNWTNTKDKRNVIVKAIGTADMRSGYVFGMHVNYDASLDPEFVRAAVERNGDEGLDMPFREFARMWIMRPPNASDQSAKRSRSRREALGWISPCAIRSPWGESRSRRRTIRNRTSACPTEGCRSTRTTRCMAISSFSRSCWPTPGRFGSFWIRIPEFGLPACRPLPTKLSRGAAMRSTCASTRI